MWFPRGARVTHCHTLSSRLSHLLALGPCAPTHPRCRYMYPPQSLGQPQGWERGEDPTKPRGGVGGGGGSATPRHFGGSQRGPLTHEPRLPGILTLSSSQLTMMLQGRYCWAAATPRSGTRLCAGKPSVTPAPRRCHHRRPGRSWETPASSAGQTCLEGPQPPFLGSESHGESDKRPPRPPSSALPGTQVCGLHV